jgi:hypothetical protein
MNSIIEAQETFTEFFGELKLSHIVEGVTLPHFSRQHHEMELFIQEHRNPAPVVINIARVEGIETTTYVSW